MRAQLSNAVLARFACICAAVQSHSNDNKARRCKGLGVTWALGLGCCFGCRVLIAEFYLVDRGLRHRLPGFSSMGRLVILP